MIGKAHLLVLTLQCWVAIVTPRIVKRQNEWSWGYENDYRETLQQEPQTTTPSVKPSVNYFDDRGALVTVDSCAPLSPQPPNFAAPGRRISQIKCYEYIWGIKYREAQKNLNDTCLYEKWKKANPNSYAAIGGRNTLSGEFPHMGAIGWKASVGSSWVFLCGATLISSTYMLTAAHCTATSERDTTVGDPIPKIVRLGDKNILDTIYKGVKPTDVNILNFIVHPEFRPPTKYNDIALLKVKEVYFTTLISPACLWSLDDTSSLGTQATLTGWGVVETASRKTSPELQAATVDLVDPPLCEQLLRPLFNRNWRGLHNQLCAGKLAGGVDACQGDSGGPLQVKIALPTLYYKIYYQIGVTQFGYGCARKNSPGVYTKVSSYIDWIESIVWPEY